MRIAFLLLILVVLARPGISAAQAEQRRDADQRLYIVGPNDVIAINVFGQPQLSAHYSVEADGTFTFPLLGRIEVGGLTLRGVEDELRKRLAGGYLRDPQVSVSVDQF